ncbi:MAG: kelch repeat-containing protein [Bacteroidia bacterium]
MFYNKQIVKKSNLVSQVSFLILCMLVLAVSCKKEPIPAVPGIISGVLNFCPGETGVVYTIAPVEGATYYLWTVPEDATIASGQGTTSVTVNFGKASGQICVKSTNDKEVSEASCLKVTQGGVSGVWCREMDFSPGIRTNAVGFSIGNKGYVGTGADMGNQKYSDLWEFDPELNVWVQKADFPGGARFDAVGFSIGDKGYVGLGYNTVDYFKDFWEYNPQTNGWLKKADFVEEREFAFGFSILNKGYVGSGRSGTFSFPQDFWEYNPQSDQWTQKTAVVSRQGAVCFSIGNVGYLGLGSSPSGSAQKDFWQYDPAQDLWTLKAELPGPPRYASAGFAIGTKGYIVGGFDGNVNYKDFYEYDSETNTWLQLQDFAGESRGYGVGFAIGTNGYIGIGSQGNSGGQNLNDFWVYGQ